MNREQLWRWEQDGAGGVHGKATYFPGMSHEVTVTLPTFKDAHTLHLCMEGAISHARWDARRGLLNEIGRIEP